MKQPGAPLGAAMALTGLTAVLGQFFAPAFAASLANIVRKDEMPRASGLLQMTNTLSMVVGPLLGGAFASPWRKGEGGTSFWSDMKEGLRYIAKAPMVRAIVITSPLINLFANAIGGVLMPVMLGRVFGTFGSLASLATPVAFTLAGFLSDRYNPILISVVSGALLVLTMLSSFILNPQIRRYQ